MDLTFNFTDKLFQPLIYTRVDKTLQSSNSSPIVVEFDLTSNCNQNCIGCVSKHLLNKGEIPLFHIKSIINILKELEVKAMIFTGGGEPLLHSSIPDSLFHAKQVGLELGLVTNGTLLYRYSSYFSDLLSWIRISIDAGTPKTYSKLHYNGTTAYEDIFYQVIHGMESFAKNKGKSRLGFSFLISSECERMLGYSNVSELYSACNLAKEIGCDYFEIKPQMDKNHYLLLTEGIMSKIKEQYEACKTLENEYFKVYCSESFQDLLNKGLSLNRNHAIQNKPYINCLVSKFRSMISWNGVFPCAYFRGNIEKGFSYNFKESCLTSDDFQNILNLIYKNVNPSNDCKWYCIRYKQNLTLQLIAERNPYIFQLLHELKNSERLDPFI